MVRGGFRGTLYRHNMMGSVAGYFCGECCQVKGLRVVGVRTEGAKHRLQQGETPIWPQGCSNVKISSCVLSSVLRCYDAIVRALMIKRSPAGGVATLTLPGKLVAYNQGLPFLQFLPRFFRVAQYFGQVVC